MNIVYVCHYFVPEVSAPSRRLYELSHEWVRMGHQVKVVTCFPNHPTGIIPRKYRGRIFQQEPVDGIQVFRNLVYATPNEGFLKKTLGHLSFAATAPILSLPRLGEVDVVIASSPTLLSVIGAWAIARTKGRPLIFEVRDLWPGLVRDLGVLKNRRIYRLLEAMELALYRQSARVVTLTEGFKRDIAARGIPDGKIEVVPNGADVEVFRPQAPDPELRAQLGLGRPFVVGYFGAFGLCQGLRTVLEAARLQHDNPAIQYVLAGDGAEKAELVRLVGEWGLKNVQVLSPFPPEQMPQVYAACDACLVPLRALPIFDDFVPSKMFEIMACGKPVLGAVRGEARRLLAAAGAAVLADPDDPASLALAVQTLAEDPNLCRQLGRRGREYVVSNFSRAALARRYLDILERVAQPHPTLVGAA